MKERLEKLTPNRLAYRTHMDYIRTCVKLHCCEAGVPPCVFLSYYSFASEIDKLQRQEISGESAVMEATVIIARWANRGLDKKVLTAIVEQLFNIALTETRDMTESPDDSDRVPSLTRLQSVITDLQSDVAPARGPLPESVRVPKPED